MSPTTTTAMPIMCPRRRRVKKTIARGIVPVGLLAIILFTIYYTSTTHHHRYLPSDEHESGDPAQDGGKGSEEEEKEVVVLPQAHGIDREKPSSEEEDSHLSPPSSLPQRVNALRALLFPTLNKELEHERTLLSDMDAIRRANNDILPMRSYFKRSQMQMRGGEQQQKGLCADEGEEENGKKTCVGKFGRGLTNFYAVTPKYKAIACILRKNMSTLLRAIFCYLRNEENILSNDISLFFIGYIMQKGQGRQSWLCDMRNAEYRTKNSIDGDNMSGQIQPPPPPPRSKSRPRRPFGLMWQRATKWKLLAMVREPIDRFLSAFVDKCIRRPTRSVHQNSIRGDLIPCNGCGYNLTCFIITEYHRMKEFESATSQLNAFQLQQFEDTMEDRHLFPQNWQCDFSTLLPHYTLIHYSSPVQRPEEREKEEGNKPKKHQQQATQFDFLVRFLKDSGVGTESLAYIRHHLEKDTTHHVTHNTEARRFLEQRLRGSPFLMEFLVRMFYWDFQLLGFPMPTLNWEHSA